MMRLNKTGLILCLIAGLFNCSNLLASVDSHAAKNFIGFFAGVLDADESDSVFGIEYEYKIDSHCGIGALYEDANDAHHGDGVSSKIAAVYYHPAGGWRLGLGLGKEKVGGAHPHSENLVRVGVSYGFHVGGIGIEPSINIDTIDGETSQVYGVALVWSF